MAWKADSVAFGEPVLSHIQQTYLFTGCLQGCLAFRLSFDLGLESLQVRFGLFDVQQLGLQPFCPLLSQFEIYLPGCLFVS